MPSPRTHAPKAPTAPRTAPERNPVVEYLENMPPDEAAQLERFAERDRKYGDKPAPDEK
jgi:hypothetical protein